MRELLALLEAMVARGGVDALHPRWRAGNLAMPRPLEVSSHPNPNANPTPTPTPTSTPNPNPNP